MKKTLLTLVVLGALGAGAFLYQENSATNSVETAQQGIKEKLKSQKTSTKSEPKIVGSSELPVTTAKESPAIPTKKESPTKKSLMDIKEGVHYDVLNTPLSLPAYNGAIISEFFWLGCPHCQNFEPMINIWKDRLNTERDTKIIKTAVPGSARWNMDSKVFYIMKELGATDAQVSQMLDLYKKQGQQYRTMPTKGELEIYFNKIGLDSKKAMVLFNDKTSLIEKLEKANSEFVKVGASGVPVFIVNGKYKVRFDNIKTNDDIYEIFRALSYKK